MYSRNIFVLREYILESGGRIMTVEMWMGLGIVVAIIGFIMWRVGLNMQAKRNRNAGMVTMIAWLLLMVGVMTAFSFFRVKYLS
jgi:hypothetical protein